MEMWRKKENKKRTKNIVKFIQALNISAYVKLVFD